MRTGRTAGEADHRASGIHVPVRRAQAREGRDEVDPAVIRHAGGDGPALCGGGDEAHLIAQPLYRAAGVEHAALKGIGRTAAEAPGYAGKHAGEAAHAALAGVHQREAAGAVGVLRLARHDAALAEQGRCLVAGAAADRHARQGLDALYPGRYAAVLRRVRHRRWQHGHRHAQNAAEVLVPAQAVYVKEHCA